MTKEVFDDFPKQIEDLINYAQFTKTIELPTESGAQFVTFSLLWESEVSQIQKKSGDYVNNPQDIMSRGSYIKMETLVHSIDKIGEQNFRDIDPETNTLLKNKLRMILGKTSPAIVQYLYDCYIELSLHRDNYVSSKTEEFKKKFQKELNGETPKI